jgi:hypothetical protein
MALYFDDLDDSAPINSDKLYTFASHLQRIKRAFKDTLPNVDGQILATDTELNHASGLTSSVLTQMQTIANAVSALQLGRKILLFHLDYNGLNNYNLYLPNGWDHAFSTGDTGYMGTWSIYPPLSLVAQQTGDDWFSVKLSITPSAGDFDVQPKLLRKNNELFDVSAYGVNIGSEGRLPYGKVFDMWGVITYTSASAQVIL